MIAIYARVSTEEQTLEPQLIELRHHAAGRGLKIAHELTDVISGAKDRRPGMDQLMALIRGRQIQTVMVVKLDRLARSLSHFCRLVDELKAHDVALVIPGQSIDTSKTNPCGEMQLAILAAVAQFERSMISERTKAGLVAARARGETLGRPSPTMVRDETKRAAIVTAWMEGGRYGGYRGLGDKLGGVAAGTAWKLYTKLHGRMPKKPKVEEFDL